MPGQTVSIDLPKVFNSQYFRQYQYHCVVTESSQELLRVVHIHINPVGGIAGDMFVAAALDLASELEKPMLAMLQCLNLSDDISIDVQTHRDSVMVGKKFHVSESRSNHLNTGYRDIQNHIDNADIPENVRAVAHRIVDYIAEAESAVHGIDVDKVILHEVGSVDSLVDIICSAYLIDALGDVTWSCDPLPSGSGFVQTAHGDLPLPVPAVTRLLTGYPLYNDGRKGERVTPTGAAILRAIDPKFDQPRATMILRAAGIGFGSASFEGISNVVRLLSYAAGDREVQDERISVLEFEVDDQSPEDLAIGLDRIRDCEGVLDVLQVPAFGKKGRMTAHIQVIGRAEFIETIASSCLSETATLGVRYQLADRKVITRHAYHHKQAPTKIAGRPDGSKTVKVEAEFLSEVGDYSARKRVRQQIEAEIENRCDKPD
ncbi:MAG: LarC family nickel insertion protein [Acidiferrobacterales bacterium]|nr:LarC family nickel insertion protein [Acidiferrobacterales bacterium]